MFLAEAEMVKHSGVLIWLAANFSFELLRSERGKNIHSVASIGAIPRYCKGQAEAAVAPAAAVVV